MQDITQQDYAHQRDMLERQQESDPNAVYADTLRDEKVRNVIAQLNPELLLSDIEHRIRGEKKNADTGGWERIGAKDDIVVDERLVQNFISFLSPYLTQNTSLSNYATPEINNIMAAVIGYVRDDLSDNSVEYGFTKQVKIKQAITKYMLVQELMNDGIMHYKQIPFTEEVEFSIGEEVTDYNAMTRIAHIVCQSTFAVLKQAQNGMLANRVFKALRVSENLNEGGKKSFMENFKFW